jgi:hypothetical protein
MNEADPINNELIKQRFREAGCRVTDSEDGYFEVIRQPFPAASLVRATPYFLEFNTILWARPQGLLGSMMSKRNSLLNRMNQVTKVAKVTCDQVSISGNEGGWRIHVLARFVTGRIESEYETESIDHWVNLWLQDLANLILEDTGFEVVALLKDRNSRN